MEYQKIINFLDNEVTQPSKIRTKIFFETNNDASGKNSTNSQTKTKTTMLKLRLCNYSDAYIHNKGAIKTTSEGADAPAIKVYERNKQIIFKSCRPFTHCIREINNTQVDNTKNLDVAMPIYNLSKCSNNYSKTSRRLWQYYRYEPNATITDSKSFKFKARTTGKNPCSW